jgi:hypothetical protein
MLRRLLLTLLVLLLPAAASAKARPDLVASKVAAGA